MLSLENLINYSVNDKTIGLKSITYWVGWYISTKNKRTNLEPGLYNFNDLKYIFQIKASIYLSIKPTVQSRWKYCQTLKSSCLVEFYLC